MFDPSTCCLKYCYDDCGSTSNEHKPHIYKLSDVVWDAYDDKEKYELARQICEYLLSSEEHKDACAKTVHSLYGELLKECGKTMDDWRLSQKHFLKAIELDPHNARMLNMYAVLHDEFEEYERIPDEYTTYV